MENLSPKLGDLEAIENASRDEIEALQLQRMRWSLNHAYKNVAHYKASFDSAGMHPDDLKSLADLSIQSDHIPGIKIKGIIFFYNGSSSNHIIVTTENNTNLKLREGEGFRDTVVESIHSNYVIFSHHNQLIEVAIGR